MWYHPQPYFEPAMWGYRHVVPVILLVGVVEALFSCEHVLEMVCYEEVMHYADHTYEALNQWSLPGIWAGCLFSLGWLKLKRWNVYYVGDGFARYTHALDAVNVSRDHVDMGPVMEKMVEGLLGQSVKILFGWTLYAGLFFTLLMLLWDIPVVRTRVKHIQTWPRVGVQVLRGFRRQQHRHKLRHRLE